VDWLDGGGGGSLEERQAEPVEETSENSGRTSRPAVSCRPGLELRSLLWWNLLLELLYWLAGELRLGVELLGRWLLERLLLDQLRLNWRRGRCCDGEVGKTVHIYGIGALLKLVSHIYSFLCGHQLDQLVAVLADDNRPEVAGLVVPLDAVVVLVVEDSQAGLVVELLQALDGDA